MFWPIFNENWNHCDDTWQLNEALLERLRYYNAEEPGVNFLDKRAKAFFDKLPDPFLVYRGCSRQRLMGVSWTRVKAVAARFALGRRGIPVPEPIVAAALVPNLAVFSVQLGRKEREARSMFISHSRVTKARPAYRARAS